MFGRALADSLFGHSFVVNDGLSVLSFVDIVAIGVFARVFGTTFPFS